LAIEPYLANSSLPTTLYLKEYMPILYEGLIELERVRPREPVEFYCAYILANKHKLK